MGGYLTFVDSDDWVEEEHLDTLILSMKDFDWTMVGMRYVDEKGESRQVRSVQDDMVAKDAHAADVLLCEVPQMGWVTNKLYKASIVQEQGLSFMEDSHIHEDRVFNFGYIQYVNSFVMKSEVTYDYLINTGSLTHNKYDSPEMFICTANTIDGILRAGKLGEHMAQYAARFMVKFYLHAFGCCVVYPYGILPLKRRCRIGMHLVRSFFGSVLLRKYFFLTLKFLLKDLFRYIKEYLHL